VRWERPKRSAHVLTVGAFLLYGINFAADFKHQTQWDSVGQIHSHWPTHGTSCATRQVSTSDFKSCTLPSLRTDMNDEYVLAFDVSIGVRIAEAFKYGQYYNFEVEQD
jgi:hypothetical protein